MTCEHDHFNHALPLVHMIILVPLKVEFNKINGFFFKMDSSNNVRLLTIFLFPFLSNGIDELSILEFTKLNFFTDKKFVTNPACPPYWGTLTRPKLEHHVLQTQKDTSRLYVKTKRQWKFLQYWTVGRQWLQYFKSENMMKCSPCADYYDKLTLFMFDQN